MTGARTMQTGEFVLQYTAVYDDRHNVLFLSHCLDPVHEHCSSQNVFEFF